MARGDEFGKAIAGLLKDGIVYLVRAHEIEPVTLRRFLELTPDDLEGAVVRLTPEGALAEAAPHRRLWS